MTGREALTTRDDDAQILALADMLTPSLARRLRDLIEAPEGAAACSELQAKAQRADDLARECRRQLRGLERAYNRLAERLGVPHVDR